MGQRVFPRRAADVREQAFPGIVRKKDETPLKAKAQRVLFSSFSPPLFFSPPTGAIGSHNLLPGPNPPPLLTLFPEQREDSEPPFKLFAKQLHA